MKKVIVMMFVFVVVLSAKVPDWFINPPKSDGNVIFVVGNGESSKLKYALRKAGSEARLNLAKSIKTRVSSVTKEMFTEEDLKDGLNKKNSAVTTFISSNEEKVEEVIKNIVEVKKYVDEPNDNRSTYSAFVLMAYESKKLAVLMGNSFKSAVESNPEIKKSMKKEVVKSLEAKEVSVDDWISQRLKDYKD